MTEALVDDLAELEKKNEKNEGVVSYVPIFKSSEVSRIKDTL
jgi:hypothetical protein